MELSVKVAMVSCLVSLGDNPPHELRPTLSMSAEDEESRLDVVLSERVENCGCSLGIRAVIEGERDLRAIRRQVAEHRPEQPAVAMKRAVRCSAEHRKTDRRRNNHTVILVRPSTAVYTSSTAAVTLGHP